MATSVLSLIADWSSRKTTARLSCGGAGLCQEFCAGIHCAGVWHWDVEALAQFYDGAYYGFEFDGAAGFEILQHGGFVFAYFFGAGDALVNGDGNFEAEFCAHGNGFFHDSADERVDIEIARHLNERGAGERADGIEGDVAENFHPDFLANASGDGAAQASGDQRFGDLAAAIGARAVGFAERDAIAFGVAYDAGLDDVGGEINYGAEDAARFDRGCDGAAGVDAFEMHAFVLAAPTLKKPPGNAVLRADDGGVWTEDGFELRDELRQAVSFYAEEDDIDGSDSFEILGNFRTRFEIAVDAFHAHTILLHGAQVRAASE